MCNIAGKKIRIGNSVYLWPKLIEQWKRADSKTILVTRFGVETTIDDLKQHFGDCGHITRVTMLKTRKGSAYIKFSDRSAVLAALKLSGSVVDGEEIVVEQKKSIPTGNSALIFIKNIKSKAKAVKPSWNIDALRNY